MGLAAYASARAQFEFYQSEIQRERNEIARWPERERDEVSSIYRKKGFSGPLLDEIVSHITAEPGRWASVMPAKLAETLGLADRVRSIPIVDPVVDYSIGMVIPQRDPMTPLIAALVQIAREVAPSLA